MMYNKLINKETKLSVIGLGYVGLPIALEFAKQIDESFFTPLLDKDGIVVDVKGVLRGRIKNHTYWSL